MERGRERGTEGVEHNESKTAREGWWERDRPRRNGTWAVGLMQKERHMCRLNRETNRS